MTKDPKHPDAEQEEAYQRSKEQAPSDQGGRMEDREKRIRERAHALWEQDGRPEGLADQHWERAASDLDREDAAIQREEIQGAKPGVRPRGDADFVRDKG
jgi:hypothetical protein